MWDSITCSERWLLTPFCIRIYLRFLSSSRLCHGFLVEDKDLFITQYHIFNNQGLEHQQSWYWPYSLLILLSTPKRVDTLTNYHIFFIPNDDVIIWKRFPYYWLFVGENTRSPKFPLSPWASDIELWCFFCLFFFLFFFLGGNPQVTGGFSFSSQRASYAENVSILWYFHFVTPSCWNFVDFPGIRCHMLLLFMKVIKVLRKNSAKFTCTLSRV